MPIGGGGDPRIPSSLCGAAPLAINAVDIDEWSGKETGDLLEDSGDTFGSGRKAIGEFTGHGQSDGVEFGTVIDASRKCRSELFGLFPHGERDGGRPSGCSFAAT